MFWLRFFTYHNSKLILNSLRSLSFWIFIGQRKIKDSLCTFQNTGRGKHIPHCGLIAIISANLWPIVFQFGRCVLVLHCAICSKAWGANHFTPVFVTLELEATWSQRSTKLSDKAIKTLLILSQRSGQLQLQERINLYIMISSSLPIHIFVFTAPLGPLWEESTLLCRLVWKMKTNLQLIGPL